MQTRPLASLLVLLLGVTGCDRIGSLFGHDGPTAGSAPASGSGGGAAAAKKDDAVPSFAGFEGEIDLSARAKSKPTPVAFNLLVKNEIVRLDLPSDLISSPDVSGFTGGGKVYGILRAAEKKLIVVLDGKQQAITIDLDQAADKAKSFRHGAPGGHGPKGAPEPSTEPPKVVKTGKMETVAGYSCEDWDVLSADKSKLSVCVADKGASFFHLPLTGIPTESAWALELMDGNHFPMKGVGFERDGSESGRIEITKLDKRTLDAAQFEVPAGYKQVTLDEILGGLGGGAIPDIPPVVPNKKGGHGHHHGKH